MKKVNCLLLVLSIVFGFSPRVMGEEIQSQSKEKYNLTEGYPIELPSKKATLPFFIYGDNLGKKANFVPSGYMGDINAINIVSDYSVAAPMKLPDQKGKNALRVIYEPKGKDGWVGVYWLAPANNWGQVKGAGYDFSQANRLSFWLKGEGGGERIAQIKMGGVNGPYPDSDFASVGPINISSEWKEYSIDLTGKDLRHIIGGFLLVLKRADNPRGAVFYLDEIVYHFEDEKKISEKSEEQNTGNEPKEKQETAKKVNEMQPNTK